MVAFSGVRHMVSVQQRVESHLQAKRKETNAQEIRMLQVEEEISNGMVHSQAGVHIFTRYRHIFQGTLLDLPTMAPTYPGNSLHWTLFKSCWLENQQILYLLHTCLCSMGCTIAHHIQWSKYVWTLQSWTLVACGLRVWGVLRYVQHRNREAYRIATMQYEKGSDNKSTQSEVEEPPETFLPQTTTSVSLLVQTQQLED